MRIAAICQNMPNSDSKPNFRGTLNINTLSLKEALLNLKLDRKATNDAMDKINESKRIFVDIFSPAVRAETRGLVVYVGEKEVQSKELVTVPLLGGNNVKVTPMAPRIGCSLLKPESLLKHREMIEILNIKAIYRKLFRYIEHDMWWKEKELQTLLAEVQTFFERNNSITPRIRSAIETCDKQVADLKEQKNTGVVISDFVDKL